MDTCPIFTAVARDLDLDPELLLTTPEVDAAPASANAGRQALR
ncbi:hypothetical protein ACFP8W_05490 [Nocardioides hankookensis]|uniref:Uncharacterized protein n=1 Tax=Nocardioides hankookensis TaxID=443157 RepID=A0ABW1LGL4_9ACTN